MTAADAREKNERTARKDAAVLIFRVEEYDRELIRKKIGEGMKKLGYTPGGPVFVKPNVVYASKNGKYGSTAYTDRSVLGGALLALSDHGAAKIDVGEKTAIGYPTRLLYKYAGYYDEVKSVRRAAGKKFGIFCIEEERRDDKFLGGLVHESLRVPRKMARADSLVYLPKLKCHCVSNMTGAVKLNIGICSDDERAIHHDYMLDDKIVDLLQAGYPDFTVMDAIDVGVGTEAVPTPRRLGLLIMGRNPLAVDFVGARLLGFEIKDVPYLQRAAERGYFPQKISQISLRGDITTLKELDRAGRRILPRDDEYYHWHDIQKNLARLKSPLRFYWGYTIPREKKKCVTGCTMGLKMFFAFIERYAGGEAFRRAKPAVIVVGQHAAEIDAQGADAFIVGSCSDAAVVNARKIYRIRHCYTTAVDLSLIIRGKLGLPAPLYAPSLSLPLLGNMAVASFMKLVKLRYAQDIARFIGRGLLKRL